MAKKAEIEALAAEIATREAALGPAVAMARALQAAKVAVRQAAGGVARDLARAPADMDEEERGVLEAAAQEAAEMATAAAKELKDHRASFREEEEAVAGMKRKKAALERFDAVVSPQALEHVQTAAGHSWEDK